MRMDKIIELAGRDYRVIAHSVIGIGKTENQDSFMVYSNPENLIVVVCDGLGSAPFSREGAEKACSIAIECLRERKDENIQSEIFHRWKDAVGGKPLLYDTTLKFIRIGKSDITIGGVGDGWIVLSKDGEKPSIYSQDHVFSNQTDSLMTFDLKEKFWMKTISAESCDFLLISTDGFSEDMEASNISSFVSDTCESIDKDHEGFEQELKSILSNWPIKTNADDKTVVMIRRAKR